MTAQLNIIQLNPNTANPDRDTVALHSGRILQSCAIVENALFRMIAVRSDVDGFSKLERTNGPALRNIIAKVIFQLEKDIETSNKSFKHPRAFKKYLQQFDEVAARRSDLAHSEFLGGCEINGARVAIVSNEGIQGASWEGRRVQLWKYDELSAIDKQSHQLANTLRQVIQNQINHVPTKR